MWQSFVVWFLVIGATLYVVWTLWPRSLLPKSWLAGRAKPGPQTHAGCSDCSATKRVEDHSKTTRS